MADKKDIMTSQEVQHLAKLANLPLTEEEVTAFTTQLQQTIAYVDNLSELDTSSVSPTSHTSNQLNITFKDGTKNERGLSPDEAVSNSRKNKGKQFVVTRIM